MARNVVERRVMRFVARVGAGEHWFPRGVSDVVSHTDGQYVTVTVTRQVAGRTTVVLREFSCNDPADCHDAVSHWLRAIATDAGDDVVAVHEWSERVADGILAGLLAT